MSLRVHTACENINSHARIHTHTHTHSLSISLLFSLSLSFSLSIFLSVSPSLSNATLCAQLVCRHDTERLRTTTQLPLYVHYHSMPLRVHTVCENTNTYTNTHTRVRAHTHTHSLFFLSLSPLSPPSSFLSPLSQWSRSGGTPRSRSPWKRRRGREFACCPGPPPCLMRLETQPHPRSAVGQRLLPAPHPPRR